MMSAGREEIVAPLCLAGTPQDVAIVQQIWHAGPIHAQITSGGPSRPGAARETLGILHGGLNSAALEFWEAMGFGRTGEGAREARMTNTT